MVGILLQKALGRVDAMWEIERCCADSSHALGCPNHLQPHPKLPMVDRGSLYGILLVLKKLRVTVLKQ